MRISGVDASWLRQFSLKKRCGRLGSFEARLHIPADKINSWLSRPGQDISVTGEPPEEDLLFHGVVTKTAIERGRGYVTAILHAVSGAVCQTTPIFSRLFQKPDKTFGDTLDASRLKMQNCTLELDNELSNEPLGPLILQSESNFSFIKRLSKISGRRMWIIDTREGSPAIALTHCLDSAVMKFMTSEIKSLRRVTLVNNEYLELSSEKYCAFGRLAQLENFDHKYIVVGLSCSIEHGRDVFRYTLERYEEGKIIKKNPEKGHFAILQGKITDIDDPDKLGRVRFMANNPCEDDSENTGSWFHWQTPYAGKNGGIVFIGEKNSPAELIFAEGSGTVRCGPRENALAEELSDVENVKYLGDIFGHHLLFNKDYLEIRTRKSIFLLKEDEISIKLPNTNIVANKNQIQISYNNSTIMIQKSIEITADNKVNITGSEINLG